MNKDVISPEAPDKNVVIDEQTIIEEFKKNYEERYGIPLDRVSLLPPLPIMPPLLPMNDKTLVWHPLPDSFCSRIRIFFAHLAGLAHHYDYYDDIPLYRCRRLGCFYMTTIIGTQSYRLRSGFPRIPIGEFIPSVPFVGRENTEIRMCVVIDPLERFRHFYRDRVLLHRLYDDKSVEESLDRLGERLDKDDFARPQSYYLGRDSSYYTHIFRHGEEEKLAALMSEIAGGDLALPTVPAHEKSEEITFSSAMKKKIQSLYQDDYKAFGNYFE